MCHLKLDMICCTAWKIYRLKISICPLLRKCSERDRRARHEPVSRRDNAMLGWSSIIIYEGYIGDCFDRIPGIVSQARRHLHDTELEVIERIHRRLGKSLFLVNHFTVIFILFAITVWTRGGWRLVCEEIGTRQCLASRRCGVKIHITTLLYQGHPTRI